MLMCKVFQTYRDVLKKICTHKLVCMWTCVCELINRLSVSLMIEQKINMHIYICTYVQINVNNNICVNSTASTSAEWAGSKGQVG